jgi:pyruvate formate lyase activating enzyme
MNGYVSNIQKFSVNDGYGIRTIVFLLGCTLNCKWCQNPETLTSKPALMYVADLCRDCGRCQGVCPSGEPHSMVNGRVTFNRECCTGCFACAESCPFDALKASGKEVSAEEVVKEVMQDEVFYRQTGGGVTVSGGEPLMQIDFCTEILKLIKKEDISTCIETAGNVPWSNFENVLPYTDLFLFDVKFASPEPHRVWTGADNALIQSNLGKLAQAGKEIIVRIPLIPEVNDGDEFQGMVDWIAELESISEIHILPFHQLGSSKYGQMGMEYSMGDYREENGDMIQWCQQYAMSRGFRVSLGGSGFKKEFFELRNND